MNQDDSGAPRSRPRPRHRPRTPEREESDRGSGVEDSHAEERSDEVHATRRFTVEDFGDLAKIGGDLLKRTVSSGFDVIKEVKEGLPKEASHLINKGKEEVLKGLSKEVMQNVLANTVDRFFSIVREHKLDISVSVRLKKAETDAPSRERR
jgi:hypothetical protein